jgi:hypothetical protein
MSNPLTQNQSTIIYMYMYWLPCLGFNDICVVYDVTPFFDVSSFAAAEWQRGRTVSLLFDVLQ